MFEFFWIYSNLFKSVQICSRNDDRIKNIQPCSSYLSIFKLAFSLFPIAKSEKISRKNSQEKNLRAIFFKLQTESRQMEYQMREINFLISVTWVEPKLLHSTSPTAHAREIRKFISFILYSICRDSVCNAQNPYERILNSHMLLGLLKSDYLHGVKISQYSRHVTFTLPPLVAKVTKPFIKNLI